MRKHFGGIFVIIAVIGTLLGAGLITITPTRHVVVAKSQSPKSSFDMPVFDYFGFTYMRGFYVPVGGRLPALTASKALAMALNLENYIVKQVEANTFDPRNAPAYIDGLVYYYPQRVPPTWYYQTSN